jgi:hypothetical protein
LSGSLFLFEAIKVKMNSVASQKMAKINELKDILENIHEKLLYFSSGMTFRQKADWILLKEKMTRKLEVLLDKDPYEIEMSM